MKIEQVMRKMYVFALFLMIISTGKILAQSNNKKLPDYEGFLVGYGLINEHNPAGYTYIPALITLDQNWTINKGGWLQLYVEAKFNPSFVKFEGKKTFSPESGINLGLKAGYTLSPGHYIYGAIGTGPHIITGDIKQQHTGFLFSDNFSAGYMFPLSQKLLFNLQFRFRHMSNAGFYNPNYGIDNWILMGGLQWRK